MIEVARSTETARSSVRLWQYLLLSEGETSLKLHCDGPRPTTVAWPLAHALEESLRQSLRQLGYLRSSWTSELLANIRGPMVRQLLQRVGYAWRRAQW